MINEQTYLNALNFARELNAQGRGLRARPSSVIGELVDLSTSFLTSEPKNTLLPAILANPVASRPINGDLSAEERANWVSAITTGCGEPSMHTLKMAALADEIAPYITAHIHATRNIVRPVVMEFAEKLVKYLETSKPISTASTFEIEQRTIPAILQDEGFFSSGLSHYMDIQPGEFPNRLPVIAGPENGDYFSLIQVGNEHKNELLRQWLAQCPPAFLENVFKATFGETTGGFEKYSVAFTSTQTRNPYDLLDLGLATYLMCVHFMANVPSIEGMTLTEYKNIMRNTLDYAASTVCSAIKTIARQIEGGVMVVEANTLSRKIVVNAAIYKEWLKEGHEPTELMGMLVSNQVVYGKRQISENSERYQRHWAGYVALSQTSERAEHHHRFKAFVLAEALQGLNDLTQMEKDYAAEHPGFIGVAAKNIEEEVEYLSHRLMDNVHHTALHIIAKARFYFTSSYTILQEMEQATLENPNLDPREAALLSLVNYVAEYAEEQLHLFQ